jgi:hypothetical protein
VAPKALVYPEIYGGRCARFHLYRSPHERLALVRRALLGPPSHACDLAERLRTSFDWRAAAPRFDARLEQLVRSRSPRRPARLLQPPVGDTVKRQ